MTVLPEVPLLGGAYDGVVIRGTLFPSTLLVPLVISKKGMPSSFDVDDLEPSKFDKGTTAAQYFLIYDDDSGKSNYIFQSNIVFKS